MVGSIDPRHLPALEKRFRALVRHLSALGWGLSQQRELKDFFDDVLSKVAQPLRWVRAYVESGSRMCR